QKSNRGAAGYSRWVNRRLGRQIAAVAYLRGLTPNQVSAISAVFTFAAIAAIAVFRSSWVVGVAAAAGLLVGYAFDSADGQVARLRGGGSPAGEWLDHVLDALKVSAFHIAIAIAWFRFFDLRHPSLLLVPLGFAVVSAVFFFALVLSDMLRRVERLKAGQSGVTTASLDPTERAPILRSLVVLPNDYGVLALSVVLIGAQTAFVVVYTALFAANALFLAAGCVRWFREMRSLTDRG
ncbi:MAG: CDP-alcohol phosphatidyltransferase, partial [Pseudonocardiales bacterium]|nr:CDP-alcohol phosphatidyltransferase [Pseudonocardiales bacterium]